MLTYGGESVPVSEPYFTCLKTTNTEMDAKKNVRAKPCEKISGFSVAISVTSLTLVMLLFMRIEFVYNNSKALETRLENRFQRIDDDLKAKLKRIVEKRLPFQESVQTRKSKGSPDVIFGKSLVTRSSVLKAFNQRHYFIVPQRDFLPV